MGKPTRCNDRRAALPPRFVSPAVWLIAAVSPHATPRLPSPSNPYDRMLGYPIVFIDRMFRVNRYPHARVHAALLPFFLQAALLLAFAAGTPRMAAAQQTRVPSAKGGVANLEAKTQGRKGDVTTADGDVDIHYGDTRLRADHVEYNGKTYEATATGYVQLDYGDEHLEAN